MESGDDEGDLLGEAFDELADVATGELTPMERVQARIDRLGRARARTVEMAEALSVLAPHENTVIGKLGRCGTVIMINQYTSIGDVRVNHFDSCDQHLLCGVCAIRRGLRLMVPNLIKYQAIQKVFPELVPLFMTITVKNGPSLSERFEHLVGAMRTLKKSRLNARRGDRRGLEFAKVAASLGSYEVKRGQGSGLWHPHCHVLALVEGDVECGALSHQWRSLTGDSFMVDVRPLDQATAPIKAFCEVFKYALKFGDLSPEDAWSAREVLRGRKLVSSAGLFRGEACPEAIRAVSKNQIDVMERRAGVRCSDIYYEYRPGGIYSVCREKSKF